MDRPEVFCGACHWYGGAQGTGSHLCLHANAAYRVTTAVGMLSLYHKAEERNATNDCPDFQPLRGWRWFRRYHGAQISLMALLWLALWLCADARSREGGRR